MQKSVSYQTRKRHKTVFWLPYVDDGRTYPFVEIVDQTLDTRNDTIENAQDDSTGIATTSIFDQVTNDLNNGDNQGSETDRSETKGCTPQK